MDPTRLSLTLLLIITSIGYGITANKLVNQGRVDNTPVGSFDIDRYLGNWHEIARYDNRFERGLDSVTANYSIGSDGRIKVVNRGYNPMKKSWSISTGRAKLTNESGLLRVSFLLFFFADYRVLALSSGDDNAPYEWALVGSGSSKYLWILARERELEQSELENILDIARSKGYETQKLLFFEQRVVNTE